MPCRGLRACHAPVDQTDSPPWGVADTELLWFEPCRPPQLRDVVLLHEPGHRAAGALERVRPLPASACAAHLPCLLPVCSRCAHAACHHVSPRVTNVSPRGKFDLSSFVIAGATLAGTRRRFMCFLSTLMKRCAQQTHGWNVLCINTGSRGALCPTGRPLCASNSMR